MDIILIPGAWLGGWVWEPVTRDLLARGHRVHPVTLSGVEENADIAGIGLGTHVEDVLSIMERKDLRDVIVVGHLYSGLVAGQVADRAPDRVAHTVFVEAFLPHDGRSMLDAITDDRNRAAELSQIVANNGRWPAPTAEDVAYERDLSADQQQELVRRFVGHPGRTITERAVLNRPVSEQRATYVECTFGGHSAADDVKAMRDQPTWTFRTLRAGHWPMVSVPDQLADVADVAAAHT